MAKERICSIDGCGNKHKALGYCSAHWQKQRRRGDPLAPPISGKRKTPPAERFAQRYAVNEETGCWEWTLSLTRKGYAMFGIDRKIIPAHRYSYEIHKGPIPDGLVLDHLCRNRKCVNPSHLEAVTDRENVLRGAGGAATNAKKTHCVRGHPLSGDNLATQHGKNRECKTCRRDYARAYARTRRARLRARFNENNGED